ncbi:MAG TPA: hypothetical protein VMR52_11805 [Dehalococcoidia bacterium]|nr:hypothetical protein [Dehalococcoidia bacterium]
MTGRTIDERGPELMWSLVDKTHEAILDNPLLAIDDSTYIYLWRSPVTYAEDEQYYAVAYTLISGDRNVRDSVQELA